MMEAIRLEGFLLSFKPADLVLLKKTLLKWGYTDDSDGVQEFLMDSVRDERLHQERRQSGLNIGGMLGGFLQDNPEILSAVAARILRKKK
jgi:hypothetical protein